MYSNSFSSDLFFFPKALSISHGQRKDVRRASLAPLEVTRARPRCRVGVKEWEVMSERYTHIHTYPLTKPASTEATSHTTSFFLLSLMLRITENNCFFKVLSMELLIENDFRKYSVPCSLLWRRSNWARVLFSGHVSEVTVRRPKCQLYHFPSVSLFSLSVYTFYVLYWRKK